MAAALAEPTRDSKKRGPTARAKFLFPLFAVFSIFEILRMGSLFDMQQFNQFQETAMNNLRSVPGIKSNRFFDRAAQEVQQVILQGMPTGKRTKFYRKDWNKTTTGGLTEEDRLVLGKIYYEADSVFEWGLGESTYIASHVGVPRYAGIDSDAAWVANARNQSLPHFRFYLADIGNTGLWGYPKENPPKSYLDYQLAPLLSEQFPFDVYMVDGRYRLACMLIAFLHASARGADPSRTKVLLHDCYKEGEGPKLLDRPQYRKADHLLDLVEHSGRKLCVYKRKRTTTDQQLLDLWLEEYREVE